ncbi:hypothetical protein SAMN05444722_2421 [Rhodovulum sp. ES.010]|uniref:hypothetical protein n=1 Tax=Rhodovulum sp. ES.010 TaxID=1882821 RepID=UPI000929CEB2|nr:hypothetical protein [Rhodovulum sp. ES.010]SIO47513.1 hypothetical protein SAMN05444722_2421 [Rhodovulum sp. ES.010]
MAKETDVTLGDMVRQAQGVFALGPVAAPQLEHFWRAQEDILEEVEGAAKKWFRRRHEAAQSALEVMHEMQGAGVAPQAALQAMADWQSQSMQRVADDLGDWVDLWSRCVGRLASAEVEAANEGVAEAVSRTRVARRSTKGATPV